MYSKRRLESVQFPARIRPTPAKGRNEMLLTILVVVLLLALIGSFPSWPHSRDWGYYPSGGISLVLLILLILFLMGRL
jgi:hypothetical protein